MIILIWMVYTRSPDWTVTVRRCWSTHALLIGQSLSGDVGLHTLSWLDRHCQAMLVYTRSPDWTITFRRCLLICFCLHANVVCLCQQKVSIFGSLTLCWLVSILFEEPLICLRCGLSLSCTCLRGASTHCMDKTSHLTALQCHVIPHFLNFFLPSNTSHTTRASFAKQN